ncbi:MAG TPA: CAP domain-containing protein [Noviherbaspirillum sp.]|uniref:CAP domain-containing protein n=1 Tax=Noviherbaspirillum sp. TaxID=1926288 RepID=UPI002B46201E|nr:CAP domain-containing protein [Noviherbaspirillum sp.]HJV87591.1 CAP domain-containing protein [Noviherbaspirillum sp.]
MGRSLRPVLSILVLLALAACGGGGNGGSGTTTSSPVKAVTSLDPGAPQTTGNTATDGFNWFNFRRQQAGLPGVARNAKLDLAAQGHSDYQKLNDTITHEQIAGKPGFTGQTTGDRLMAAGYLLPAGGYAYGEVISATSDRSGFNAAEDLIAAIYHRFVIFEPIFKEGGSGAATVTNGLTYFTTDFATIGIDTTPQERSRLFTYPYSGQQRVPVNFLSDNEVPDPVPNINEVGYPVSVHSTLGTTLAVQSFTIRPRGGDPLPVQLLRHDTDPQTPGSAVAIIPLGVLKAATTYDVQFTGSLDGAGISRSWAFTTQ